MRTAVIRRDTTGITFAVDDVEPATAPRPERKAHEAVRAIVGTEIESCSDYHAGVVDGIRYQPLLAAVYVAFSEHRPLVLSPDSVWITIAQGVAHHMAIHGERLRSRFASHTGHLDLVFMADWVAGSPENPWVDAFESWATQIRDHVGHEVHDALVCDFGTTSPHDRAASHIVLMDVFQRYFHYEMRCICGIPSVTLEGSPADWERLADKARRLRMFDMDWWLDRLDAICAQFAAASHGRVDRRHWRRICKLREAYGGHIINGWVCELFPYLQEFIGGPCRQRNPIFETGEGMQALVAPSGLSRVPFRWCDARTGKRRAMEAIGGLLGVTQDPRTLALRPRVGWAVREGDKLDGLLERLRGDGHVTREGADIEHREPEDDDTAFAASRSTLRYLPVDLCSFYYATDGADLFDSPEGATCRIVRLTDITPLEWGEGADDGSRGFRGCTWHRIASLRDGSWLAINLDLNRRDPRPWETWADRDPNFAPICHCGPGTAGEPGKNPVIAFSFTELLDRLLAGGDGLRLGPEGEPYGDAEQYTRRD